MDPANVLLPEAQELTAELTCQGTRQKTTIPDASEHCGPTAAAASFPSPIAMDNPKVYCGFFNLCTIHFEVLTHQFVLNRAKMAFFISLLSDEALA